MAVAESQVDQERVEFNFLQTSNIAASPREIWNDDGIMIKYGVIAWNKDYNWELSSIIQRQYFNRKKVCSFGSFRWLENMKYSKGWFYKS